MENDWQAKLAAMKQSMAPGSEVEETSVPPQQEQQSARLDIEYQKKGRAGRPCTIISGFTLDDAQVAEIASRLKKSIGTGGSARGGEILVQGDRRQQVLQLLVKWGMKARII